MLPVSIESDDQMQEESNISSRRQFRSPPKTSSGPKPIKRNSKRKLTDNDCSINDELNPFQAIGSFTVFGRPISISAFLDSSTSPILLPTLSHRQKLEKHL
jgi:hypothetical protein